MVFLSGEMGGTGGGAVTSKVGWVGSTSLSVCLSRSLSLRKGGKGRSLDIIISLTSKKM